MYSNIQSIEKPASIDPQELARAIARGRRLRSQRAWHLLSRLQAFINQIIRRQARLTADDSLWQQAPTMTAQPQQAGRGGWL